MEPENRTLQRGWIFKERVAYRGVRYAGQRKSGAIAERATLVLFIMIEQEQDLTKYK